MNRREEILMIGVGTGIDGLNYHLSSEATSRLKLTTHTTEAVVRKILGG